MKLFGLVVPTTLEIILTPGIISVILLLIR